MESSNMMQLFLDFVLTALIYSGPILVYRFAIRRRSAEAKVAKKIAIIYAIFSLILMSAVLIALNTGDTPGAAWMLWSFVNYGVLVSGRSQS